MPPTVILIRHAQALHNVASDWSIHDPPLSELGERQCAELQENLRQNKLANEVELIIVSAMRRTLQTASLGLDWLINEKKVRIVPDAGWQGKLTQVFFGESRQPPPPCLDMFILWLLFFARPITIRCSHESENADKPCDTGSPITTMAKEFPYDFSSVDPLYPDKTTHLRTNPYAFTRKAILARGQACLKSLYARPEKVIAVVSHSGFLRTAVCNRQFFNADYRIFDFDLEKMKKSKDVGEGIDGEGLFYLKEWPETEEKGGGMGRSEKGIASIVDTDFPPETDEDSAQNEKVKPEVEEVTKEVPEKVAA